MRPAVALTVSSCLLLAGCGGSGSDTTTTVGGPGGGMTLEELWRAPGDDVAMIAGTANHEPGNVRVSFLVVDAEGQLVTLPTARVWVADGLAAQPFLESSAKLERIGVPGGDVADASHIYVAHLKLDHPGKYWLLAEPEGGATKVQALGNVVVAKKDPAPDIGDPAIASNNPTIASTGGNFPKLTTRTPPDASLLEYSIADSLEAKVPFVVTFSTPKFCSSRTCGPVVDVVEEVASRFESSGIRFIHVEVYEGNDPAKGYNRFVQEWGLTTEPWTFVVDRTGKIVERYEGPVSVNELEQAVREKLHG
ncbi:MAG: thioredoxin family protein [Thermoleophilia bacterium]|nr:thioredoxin family protein [Thermoleophilia bacterium]MDH4339694.1 thioredoxin family protein [Thermoleophilia bacterium]